MKGYVGNKGNVMKTQYQNKNKNNKVLTQLKTYINYNRILSFFNGAM